MTTIGYERTHNKALQFTDEAAFVEFALNTAPPEPVYYPRMKKINAEGPEVLGRLPTCPPLVAKEFQKAVAGNGQQVLDNRQMLAFGGGHIMGAMNIGPLPELSIWAGWMLDPEKPIFLVLPKDADLPEVQRQLIRVGCTKFGGYLLGGMEEWDSAGLPLARLSQMTVHEVKERADDIQVLDVRSPEEWEDGHIPGAQYIFLPDLEKKAHRLAYERKSVHETNRIGGGRTGPCHLRLGGRGPAGD